MTILPKAFEESLRASGALADDERILAAEQLAGGVSSDIWKVVGESRTICAKRALSRLKVADDWTVPTERNRYEALWYETVGAVLPGAAPDLLGSDNEHGVLAMEYLEPGAFELWKTKLAEGRALPEDAALVGTALGRIHSACAHRPDLAESFPTTELFEALRLAPYLRHSATRHPTVADRLTQLADRTAAQRIALVHGDVSPKNILIGDGRIVMLDAECAWYGDPAFDPAFCLKHLLLKSVWVPWAHDRFQACFRSLWSAYRDEVDWEEPGALAARTAKLIGALMLGRIDGMSPVEYITDEADKERVRSFARTQIASPADDPLKVAASWDEECRRRA